MNFIAADINKPPVTVFSCLLYHGGIEPRSRVRRLGVLSVEELELIFRGFVCGKSIRNIVRDIDRRRQTLERYLVMKE